MKRLPVFFIMILFAACSNRSSVPGDIIPIDSMTVIMKDIIMANEYSQVNIPKDSTKKDKILANQELLDGVFKIHHITKRIISKKLPVLRIETRPEQKDI